MEFRNEVIHRLKKARAYQITALGKAYSKSVDRKVFVSGQTSSNCRNKKKSTHFSSGAERRRWSEGKVDSAGREDNVNCSSKKRMYHLISEISWWRTSNIYLFASVQWWQCQWTSWWTNAPWRYIIASYYMICITYYMQKRLKIKGLWLWTTPKTEQTHLSWDPAVVSLLPCRLLVKDLLFLFLLKTWSNSLGMIPEVVYLQLCLVRMPAGRNLRLLTELRKV